MIMVVVAMVVAVVAAVVARHVAHSNGAMLLRYITVMGGGWRAADTNRIGLLFALK